ncbi:MAG: efflux RND transporter periplasmic adaptor subunit [Pseudomonadota bacterium]
MRPARIAAGGLLCVVLLGACDTPPPAPVAEQSIRPARLFRVAPVTGQQRFDFVARVDAAQTVDLAFEVGGPLLELKVREGETVRSGALLAALEPTDFRLAVREARAALTLARQDLARQESLLERRVVSEAAVDEARAVAERATVQLAQAQEALADARLVAPFNAYVARRYVDPYTNLQPAVRVLRLHDLSELHLVASVPEALLATVSADRVAAMEARFAFAPERAFPVRYLENSGEADAVAQTYAVTFAMPRPEDFNVLPGMTATVRVVLKVDPTVADRPRIQTSALVAGADGGFFVWIYDPATQTVARRSVVPASVDGGALAIRSGLEGDDLIVSTGASQLLPGMRIRPLNPEVLAAEAGPVSLGAAPPP